MSERPTAKGILVALSLGCVFMLVAAEGVLRFAMPHWREFYSGWFIRTIRVPDHGVVTTGLPGFDGFFAQYNGDFRVRVRLNDFGLRNPDPVDKAGGRVWVIGDSMTFGWGVGQDEIYSSVAGRLLKVPTYNIASPRNNVCGYQALLARMPESVRPSAVIIGLVLENDVRAYDCRAEAKSAEGGTPSGNGTQQVRVESVNIFLTKYTALYNFFAVSLTRVAFIQDALGAFGLIEKPHTYERSLSEAKLERAIERTAAEIDALRTMLPAGTPLAVLIVPGRFEIKNGDPFFRELRQGMGRALAGRGIAAIDPIEEFTRAGFEPTHFPHDGHWSPLGHEIAGRTTARWLRGQGIGG